MLYLILAYIAQILILSQLWISGTCANTLGRLVWNLIWAVKHKGEREQNTQAHAFPALQHLVCEWERHSHPLFPALSFLPLVAIGLQIFLEWHKSSVVPKGSPPPLSAAHSHFTCKLNVRVGWLLDLLFYLRSPCLQDQRRASLRASSRGHRNRSSSEANLGSHLSSVGCSDCEL